MVSPIFFIFLLLSVRLISCDALCDVVLDVVVEDGVVVLVVALRSSELCHFIGYGFGVRHDCAAGDAHPRVTVDVANLGRASLLVHHERTLVHAGGGVRLVALPVQKYNNLGKADFRDDKLYEGALRSLRAIP